MRSGRLAAVLRGATTALLLLAAPGSCAAHSPMYPSLHLPPVPLPLSRSDILEENVVQPLLVSTSEITLATETVRLILKIDDIVATR